MSKPIIKSASLDVRDVERAVHDGARRIFLQSQHFATPMRIDEPSINGVPVSKYVDGFARQWSLQLSQKIALKKFDYKEVKYPDGWWQFLKHEIGQSKAMSFAPVRWFLQRHPVKFVTVTMEACAYYPDIEIPDQRAFVDVMVREEREGRWQ
jgi:hypothetical protein